MTVNIHASTTGSGPDVILIHGLFGMGSNLGALARVLQDQFTVHSLDLPNHGNSGWVDSVDIPAMAAAVLAWMDQLNMPSVSLVGHSLGGKVAMELALQHSQRIQALVVADIAPVLYPAGHANEFAALNAVAQAKCGSRTEARQIMSRHVHEDAIVQFLAKNLGRSEDGSYGWKFNLDGVRASYDAIRAGIESREPYEKPVLFIKGGDSNYIQESHRARITQLFPAAALKVIPGCGHWLHAQQPRLFNNLVVRFLSTHCLTQKKTK
ncbi:MAG: alpha/beta fold hydrolase [Halioglobus sp.]